MKKIISLVLSLSMIFACLSITSFNAFAGSYIGADKAKQIALDNAHLKSSQVTFTKSKFDTDNGIKVYEIEFYTPLAEYEYEINAKSGSIKEKDIDYKCTIKLSNKTYTYNGKAKKPSVTITKNQNLISVSNYTVSYINNVKPGKATVKIVFNGKKYSDTFTRKITIKPKKQSIISVTRKSSTSLKVKWKKDSTVTGYQLQYSRNSDFSNGKKISISGFDKTSKTLTSLASNKKYYVRIRAYKTVKAKRIYGKWSAKGSTGTSYIGVAKAKEIALKDAGLTTSQVTFVKAYLDTDDGIKVYDIEFTTSTKEYEYEINAKTGKIIEKDVERL